MIDDLPISFTGKGAKENNSLASKPVTDQGSMLSSSYLLRYNTAMAKWYLRIIGIFFVLVSVSLVTDYVEFGFRPETMHKVFHVLLGLIVLCYGWNDPRWWRPFAVANGGFFTFVGLFGWLFPDFGGLDAFNRLDTVLHSAVGLSGLMVGWFYSYDGIEKTIK